MTPHDDVATQAGDRMTIEILVEVVREVAGDVDDDATIRLLRMAARTLEDQAATIASLQDQLARCREGKP